MKTRYFNNVNCIEELKKQYFALAKLYHSDITGGSDEAMKAINAEYSDLFKVYKEDLKKLGCRWSPNKKAWSWHYPEDGSRNHKKAWDFNKIRNTYGSVSYTNDEQLQLNGAF